MMWMILGPVIQGLFKKQKKTKHPPRNKNVFTKKRRRKKKTIIKLKERHWSCEVRETSASHQSSCPLPGWRQFPAGSLWLPCRPHHCLNFLDLGPLLDPTEMVPLQQGKRKTMIFLLWCYWRVIIQWVTWVFTPWTFPHFVVLQVFNWDYTK